MRLLAFLRKLDRARRDRRERPELAAFREAASRLRPGEIAIDCGANVGKFTTMLAATGATVHAFEPNPDAFAVLRAEVASLPNVKPIQAAVSTEPGEVRLYLHKYSRHDPLYWSTSSSLLAGKRNVDREQSVVVQAISLAAFIRDLAAPVALLKMDVEGAEVEILNHLIDEGLHERIAQAFVEVHDRKVEALVEPTRRLRERLQSLGITSWRLDWR